MTPNLKDLILAQLPEEKDVVDWHKEKDHGYNVALQEIRSKLESLDLSQWIRVSDVRAAVEIEIATCKERLKMYATPPLDPSKLTPPKKNKT